MAKYDDGSWHWGGSFPSDLPPKRACTHIGMFLGWAIDNGLEGELLKDHLAQQLAEFRSRKITGSELLHEYLDDKLTDDCFNDDANAFAQEYYDESSTYFNDYAGLVGRGLPTLYHVTDDWRNYALVKNLLDRRFAEWQRQRKL